MKLNVITTILTLICTSCAPDNQIDPYLNSSNDMEKMIQDYENRSRKFENLEFSNQEYQELKLKIEKAKRSADLKLKTPKTNPKGQKKEKAPKK
ncbi:complement regulator-acquiring protein [Borreliella valaisiana]|uniref:complement regulator-acquiring protein n=1 Tax=Borreliella valaisiana TaxID=62088 RepID=UPI002ED11EDE|nr:complement regulator-acquiring protein [Borreliella valaisiana]